MKVALVSHHKELIRKHLKKAGLKETTKNPDVIVSFGGEGTCLFCEQVYPTKPKLFITHHVCRNCKKHNYKKIFDALKSKNYKVEKLPKLEARVDGKKLSGMNEINIHYKPPRALRLRVKVNGKVVVPEMIGDGVVVATPYGSTAYFRSITGRSFSKGFGIAFNNSVKRIRPLFVNENAKIEVDILRENGFVSADTNKKLITIKKGNKIIIKKSGDVAKIIRIKGMNLKIKFK